MKKITKREAITACEKIWSELAKSGDNVKPEWAVDKYVCGCPCCEYGKQQRLCCEACLLHGLWENNCCQTGSPYGMWEGFHKGKRPNITLRKKYAKIIADYAKMLLKKMDKKVKP